MSTRLAIEPKGLTRRRIMPVKYEPEVRKSFIAAAFRARKGGGGWEQAFRAAKAHGYKGSVEGINQMLRAAQPEEPQAAKQPATTPPGANGHQKEVSRLPEALKHSLTTTLSEGLKDTVTDAVKEMTNAAIDKVIGTLQKAKV